MDTSPLHNVVRFALLVPFLMLAGCQSAAKHDLELNAEAYRGSGYQSSYMQRRSVFIRHLRDSRGRLEPYAEDQFPVVYTEDRYWDRPLVVMLNGVFRKELSDAGLFAQIVDKEEDADWVVEPVLLQFHGAVEQRVTGRKYRAMSELHVTVWGKPDAAGQRHVLRQQKYEGKLDLGGETYAQINPYGLASASFARCMGSVLIDLDLGGQLADGISPKMPRPTDFEAQTEWSPASTGQKR